MRLYTVLLYFLQTALSVSDDTLTHHQEHTHNCNYNIWHWSNRICYRPTSARCCNYSYECAPDDGWGYHPKHLELSAGNIIKLYTGCNRRNGPDFGRVFLRSNYTDITQNTYIQSWKITETLAREKSGLLWCLRTVLVSVTSFSPLFELHSYARANVAPAT